MPENNPAPLTNALAAEAQPATTWEAQQLAIARAAGYTLTVESLRRNHSRAVDSAVGQAETALRNGDSARAHAFLELAAAIQHDGETPCPSN